MKKGLVDEITQIIKDYSTEGRENERYKASKIGNQLYQEGIPPDKVVGLFIQALHQIEQADQEINAEAMNILLEMIMTYSISFTRSHEQLKRSQEQLEELVEERTQELKRSNKELKKLNQMKDQFLGMATHELRTPLVSIKGYIDYIQDGSAGEVPDKIEELLDIVQRNTQRLESLTDDLLDQ
ncbi:MAG: histidine kinase dimerization/phospho-acceptor domain-containing protein, partial [Thermoproteota archaeon]